MASLVQDYLHELLQIRGIGVAETSGYSALRDLLNGLGSGLKPKVRCVINPANAGAGIPDGGLYTPDQFPRGGNEPLPGLLPSRGGMEVKPVSHDIEALVASEQVRKYLDKYRQVLLTNYRQFLLLTCDAQGQIVRGEHYDLAATEAEFWELCRQPQNSAKLHEERFTQYLSRVMLQQAKLTDPQAVAWFLASYARDAKSRLELKPDMPALAFVRSALEEALGLKFEGEKGDHFFRSTLVQTLFYGIFAAWVLWHKENPTRQDRFDWHLANWSLHVPMISALYEQIATPGKLEPLDLTEVLDWAGAALSRVDRATFFQSFDEGHAVQYFYEPFLQAFDPELRKELGVWYTPPEIVQYMVARVDTVLREELGVADGLADDNVYILDPCCGTGAYLVEVLRKIEQTRRAQSDDALVAQDVKAAAIKRVFGFEIMPAPFVVSHLQLGLHLANLKAPMSGDERAGVYLTNALTGWEPPTGAKQALAFPEMEQEREAAHEIKSHKKILVVLGNPPYNGFAGVAVEEERDLSNAYRTTKNVAAPQGQGLNDLYVRFFRMAERRIVEMSGEGIVCFISNYSWLDGLSFTGMRERYLEVFDKIWIDCLNGDKYKTGKATPDGEADPSIFSTEFSPAGIQVGTSIALLAHSGGGEGSSEVEFRHLWGRTKREQLAANASGNLKSRYDALRPLLALGLPLMPGKVADGYVSWPLIADLMPTFSPGVNTSRDLDLVDVDHGRLLERMESYFDPSLSDEELRQTAPSLSASTAVFNAPATRQKLLVQGIGCGEIVRYAYRPFDIRWAFWTDQAGLLDRSRPELRTAQKRATSFLTTRQKAERQNEGTPFFAASALPDRHLTRPGSICLPRECELLGEHTTGLFADGSAEVTTGPNVSSQAASYVSHIDVDSSAEDSPLWLHALAIGYSPAYLTENADGIRQDWPRIPLPASRDDLLASAELGRQVAALLDTETSVPGVSSGAIRPGLRSLGVITCADGGQLNLACDLGVTAGWGHAGKGGVTMPGTGDARLRDYQDGECVEGLGERTYDIYLNDRAYWKNVPERVWEYTIGGYQVIKKWLSYRESKLLGRSLKPEEARYVQEMVRRLAAIILLEPELDANYERVKANTFPWESLKG